MDQIIFHFIYTDQVYFDVTFEIFNIFYNTTQ